MPIALNEVQGNIIRPFGRAHSVFLFVRFEGEPAAACRAFRKIVHRFVVSAAQQAAITEEWKPLRGDREQHGRTLGCFGLSASGYERLGLQNIAPSDEAFGSLHPTPDSSQSYWSWDPDKPSWEETYRTHDLDAFLLLSDDWLQRLDETVAAAKAALSAIGVIVKEERGRRLSKNPNGQPTLIEHFGFRDDKSKGADPMSLLADNRPGSHHPHSAFGCFATFMKIEQHVERFRKAAADLAKLSGGHTQETIEEFAVGRQKDGDPLPGVPIPAEGGDFTFTGVPEQVCPYHAHIRVMNHRDGSDVDRILRRGVAYGPEPANSASEPSGILFLSMQRKIADFGILIGRAIWNMDPILSRSRDWIWQEPFSPDTGLWQNGKLGQRWSVANPPVSFAMTDMTTVRGAEFFFLPCVTFLESVVEG